MPQTTTDNAILNKMTADQDETLSSMIPSTIAFLIKDNWGYSIHGMAEATLVKKPKAEYSKDPNDRIWVFKGELTNHKVQGNGPALRRVEIEQ